MKINLVTIFLLSFILLNQKAYSSDFNIKAKTVILQDTLSGKILFEKEPDLKIFPASMTKIMTTIIAFDLLKQGQLSLDEKFFSSCFNYFNIFKVKWTYIIKSFF